MSFEALHALNTFLRTPGADKFSRRGCELISQYLKEAEHRGFACIQLAYEPEVKKQYGMDVVNDLLTRAHAVVRGANRLYAVTALLETNYQHPISTDPDTIKGLQLIVSEELPNMAGRLAQMSKVMRTIMHTVEV